MTVELAELSKQAYVNKYLKVEKTFAKYFAATWQKKKWTYAEVNALLESEKPEDYHPACNPPQSNSIERQNRTQKEVSTNNKIVACLLTPPPIIPPLAPQPPPCLRSLWAPSRPRSRSPF